MRCRLLLQKLTGHISEVSNQNKLNFFGLVWFPYGPNMCANFQRNLRGWGFFLLIWYGMTLEWLKYPARSYHCAKHTYQHPDRCFRVMGMWWSLWPSLAATEMVRWMHAPRYHGKGTCSHGHNGNSVGALLAKQRITLQCDNLSLVNSIKKAQPDKLSWCIFSAVYGFLQPTMTLRWQPYTSWASPTHQLINSLGTSSYCFSITLTETKSTY